MDSMESLSHLQPLVIARIVSYFRGNLMYIACAPCFVFWVPFDGTSHTQIPCNYHDSYTYYLCCPSIVPLGRNTWLSTREFTLECILLTNNIIVAVKLPVFYVLHVRTWIISREKKRERERRRGKEIAWLVYRCRDMYNFLTAFAMRWDLIDDMEVIHFLSSSSFVLYTPPSTTIGGDRIVIFFPWNL